ncbi:hypothetical protein V6N11_017228 [Hibiscus sabdariffa]|uniref:Uncharacterized protein n=1 Tax=Hibiscus sabdariffa TaxID=183260 RepID=A0ABR2TXN9_9ROSI
MHESACSNLRSYLAPRPIILTRNGSRARCPRRSPATDPPSVDVVMADFVQATTKRATRKKGEGHGWLPWQAVTVVVGNCCRGCRQGMQLVQSRLGRDHGVLPT